VAARLQPGDLTEDSIITASIADIITPINGIIRIDGIMETKKILQLIIRSRKSSS